MRLIFLGTGGGGIPPIGVDATAADLVRRGSNALVLQPNYPDPPTVLVDAGADIRTQWLDWMGAPPHPDAIVLTHGHLDHIEGIVEFRRCMQPVPVYADATTLTTVAQYGEFFVPGDPTLNLAPQELPERGVATVAGIAIETFPLHHNMPLTGFVVRHGGKTIANLTDTAATVESEVRKLIAGCDVLIVNTPFLTDYLSHISIPQAISLAEEVAAKRLVLLHFSHLVPERDLARLAAAHPQVTMAHDGMTLDL